MSRDTYSAYDLEEEMRFTSRLLVGFGLTWVCMVMGAILLATMRAASAGVIP